MIAINSKFHGSGLIRSGFNKALFRVQAVQENNKNKKRKTSGGGTVPRSIRKQLTVYRLSTAVNMTVY